MLIQFTVGNFLSFRDRKILSLEAKGISELADNVIPYNRDKLLRSAVIYGANSSGKSNLLKAMQMMRQVILLSVKLNDGEELPYSPFLLSTETENKPTFLEMIFWKDGIKYRYGFEYTLTRIVNEWLFTGKSESSEKPLFIRTEEGIGVADRFEEGKDKESATNDNRLFISLVAQLGGAISKKIIEFFKDYNVLSGIEHDDYTGFTIRMLHKSLDGYKESMSLFQKLKLGFKDIMAIESDFDPLDIPDDLPKNVRKKVMKEFSGVKRVLLKTIHNKFDKNGNVVEMVPLDKVIHESEGTNKIVDLSGPIFDTLLSGKILVIDELDAKLHPSITIQVVELFNSRKTNPNNAQLIFATHDTHLLSEELFRRDQIWFTEKDEWEQTDLYSLYEFTLPDGGKVRSDANMEKNYLRGRYGAIPVITD